MSKRMPKSMTCTGLKQLPSFAATPLAKIKQMATRCMFFFLVTPDCSGVCGEEARGPTVHFDWSELLFKYFDWSE